MNLTLLQHKHQRPGHFLSTACVAFLLLGVHFSVAWADRGLEVSRSGNCLVLENESIRLEVSDRLVLKPCLKTPEGVLSLVAAEPELKPSFSITVGGKSVEDFRVDWQSVRRSEIEDSLGPGCEISLRAVSAPLYEIVYKNVRLEAQVSLTFYDKYPSTVVTRVTFKNLSAFSLKVDCLKSAFFRLDRRLVDPKESPWSFASYQGASYHWGKNYTLVWLTPDFEQRNFMGVDPYPNKEILGWGTPLIDLWTPHCGLALASVEPQPEWFSLPVRTANDGLVEVALEEEPATEPGRKASLAPNETCSTLRTAVILHRLDYYDPLSTLSEILRDRGIAIPRTSPPQSYEPYWKTWAFKTNFTLDRIYAVLPQLKRIGVGWANLDDGWFTFHGDWEPNPAPGKFPGGEANLKAFVRRLHKEGFKSSLWWYPQGVNPNSRLVKEHPELLVRNPDGSLPVGECGDYYLCPCLPASLDFIRGKVTKIMQEWDFDGLYVDFSDITSTPPCYAQGHGHSSPLESFREQYKFYQTIYETAQRIKPGCPVEMCVCALPHDPFKMPFYNVASASDPVTLGQTRRRVKVEKALHGPTFCVGDAYQLPIQDWYPDHRPESFENGLALGAQLTTFFKELTPEQEKNYKHWFGLYNRMGHGLADGEYLNLYDVAFDRPEGYVVRKRGKLFYGFFADTWYRQDTLRLRGLEPGRKYAVRDYASDADLGTVSGDQPIMNVPFKESLLLELTPLK